MNGWMSLPDKVANIHGRATRSDLGIGKDAGQKRLRKGAKQGRGQLNTASRAKGLQLMRLSRAALELYPVYCCKRSPEPGGRILASRDLGGIQAFQPGNLCRSPRSHSLTLFSSISNEYRQEVPLEKEKQARRREVRVPG